MHIIVRGFVGLLLLPVIWGASKMAVYGSMMSAFTNDHTSAADTVLAVAVVLGCFIAPVWALVRPGRRQIAVGWITLLLPLTLSAILARILGLAIVLMLVWYIWSAFVFRRLKA